MSAANIVSTGDLHVQVPVHGSEGDLAEPATPSTR